MSRSGLVSIDAGAQARVGIAEPSALEAAQVQRGQEALVGKAKPDQELRRTPTVPDAVPPAACVDVCRAQCCVAVSVGGSAGAGAAGQSPQPQIVDQRENGRACYVQREAGVELTCAFCSIESPGAVRSSGAACMPPAILGNPDVERVSPVEAGNGLLPPGGADVVRASNGPGRDDGVGSHAAAETSRRPCGVGHEPSACLTRNDNVSTRLHVGKARSAEGVTQGTHRGRGASLRHARSRRQSRRRGCAKVEEGRSTAAAPARSSCLQSTDAVFERVSTLPECIRFEGEVIRGPASLVEWQWEGPPPLNPVNIGQASVVYDARGPLAMATALYEEGCKGAATAQDWSHLVDTVWRATESYWSVIEWCHSSRLARQEAAALDLPSVIGRRLLGRDLCLSASRQLPVLCSACEPETDDQHLRDQAVRLIVARWRARQCGPGLSWWDERVTRARGHLLSHVIFLQRLFRAASSGGWTRGGARGRGRLLKPTEHRCRGGKALAAEQEFAEQRKRAESVLAWYDQYVALLRRLEDGQTPSVLHLYGGGGGSSEGGRRAGATGFSVDSEEQPDYVRRFGAESFVQGDATSWSLVNDLDKKRHFSGCMASPPCKPYSRALSGGKSMVPPLIPITRDLLMTFFDYWAIENVLGASKEMSASSIELFGQMFGCKVDRARKIESNFSIHVDEYLRRSGMQLRRRSCLGSRRRWRRVDEFGRPAGPCCPGNIFAVQGVRPWRCTADECSEAMDLDRGQMSYDRLAQAIPPAYSRLVIAQMCMQIAADRYGVPVITYDDMLADPVTCKRRLAPWLVGAGDDRADAGLALVGALPVPTASGEASEQLEALPHEELSIEIPGLEEDRFRELDYSAVGDFTQRWTQRSDHWLDVIRPHNVLSSEGVSCEQLRGHNTFIEVPHGVLLRSLPEINQAVRERGTRVSVRVQVKSEGLLRRNDFRREAPVTSDTPGWLVMSAGKRSAGSSESFLDHSRCSEFMDPRDCGRATWAESAKRELAWSPVWWTPELWESSGLDESIVKIMTEGAQVELARALESREVSQYPFASDEARAAAAVECDRAIVAGHMEYVPPDEVEEALKGVVHPWTMTYQAGKWRACQDYSVGTNLAAKSAPFGLPTTWDVRKVIKPGQSFFCKYDLRDGFWHVPVEQGSRNRLLMRHAASGRLIRCRSLPFGFLDSPRLFCSVTEAVAQEFRKRAAGKGIHIWCYVDDYLVMGDSYELAKEGGALLEQILYELGFQWAPHKQRGPCQCIEFLGLLIVNFEELCCLALPEKKQGKLQAMIADWQMRRPSSESQEVLADPRELAQLLGHLVFASQVVPGGRVAMQGMLSQFKGLTVDWRRSLVQVANGKWQKISLSIGFWRDLEWWDDCMQRRNCVSLVRPERGEAAITGTDASGWGTGQVAWIDGGKDESRLRFGQAEQRRPINWRELLGIIRIIDIYGEQLRGKCVLVETDNTSARAVAGNLYSKAEDMQELVRRLLERSVKYGIHMRFTHTPGVKLYRPDQTSRGDPIEEPRVRWARRGFETMARRFGPFKEFIGAERQHQAAAGHSGSSIWMHPTFTTVGSALRLLGERLMAAGGERAHGLVVVPDEPSAHWSKLLKHFTVVGRRPEGDTHLEMSRMGAWKRVTSNRSTLVLSFPRAAGASTRCLWVQETEAAGYVPTVSTGGFHLPCLKGSIVYAKGAVPGTRGELYIVWKDFDPAVEADLVEGHPDVELAELVQVRGISASSADHRKSMLFCLSNKVINDKYGRRPESFSRVGSVPWSRGAETLWDVSHLVSEVAPTWKLPAIKKGAGTAALWAQKAFKFDFEEAERQIAFAMSAATLVPVSPAVQQIGLQLAGELFYESPGTDASPVHAGATQVSSDLSSTLASALVLADPDTGRDADQQLAEANTSAAEAAAARSRPEAVPARQRVVPMEPWKKKVQRCQYPGMPCSGCRVEMAVGDQVVPAGDGLAHAVEACVQLAQTALLDAAAKASRERGKGALRLDSEKRQAQLIHRFGADRLQLIMKCLDGKCGVHDERRKMCEGWRDELGERHPCGKGVHTHACCKIDRYHAETSMLVCIDCRVKEMSQVSCSGTEAMRLACCRNLLIDLTTGATSTAKNVAEFERLKNIWMADMRDEEGQGAASLRPPDASEESMKAFLIWLVTDAGRARSFGTLVRMTSIALVRMEKPDLTAKPSVKAAIKELATQIGTDPDPCTIPSPPIITTMLLKVLPDQCDTPYILARSKFQFDLEVAGGCRLSETAGGGIGHGGLAELVDIATPIGGGDETINLFLEDTKVGFKRDVTFYGKTRGPLELDCAQNLRNLWKELGLTIVSRVEDGMTVEAPDYKVVRVSLLGMDRTAFKRFTTIVENTDEPVIVKSKGWILKYANSIFKAKTLSEEAMFVNIAGGEATGSDVRRAVAWLEKYSYSCYNVVAGPLLRATHSRTIITHMPIAPKSTYADVPKAMMKAYKMNLEEGVVDTSLDLEGLEKPKFGHHANRRYADKTARDTREETGCDEGEIDDFFGWDQRLRQRKSQLHYHGRNDRLKRARITMML